MNYRGFRSLRARYGHVAGTRSSAGLWSYDVAVAEDALARIDIDPAVSFGKPRVRGTRISVGLVLSLMADGMTQEEILTEYPALSIEDVHACLAFAAKLAVGRFVDVA